MTIEIIKGHDNEVADFFSSPSNTPETDALRKSIDSGANAEAQMTSFARKLERERDEAREKAERYRLNANAIMLQRDEAREERDELRSEINYYRIKHDLLPISWDV